MAEEQQTLHDRSGAPSVQGLWDQGLFVDALLSAERIAAARAPLVLQNYRFATEDEGGPRAAKNVNP